MSSDSDDSPGGIKPSPIMIGVCERCLMYCMVPKEEYPTFFFVENKRNIPPASTVSSRASSTSSPPPATTRRAARPSKET
jgi:hypothetical protein